MMTEDEWAEHERQRRYPWLWRIAEAARLRDLLVREQGSVCAICGTVMVDEFANPPTIDHVIALGWGGADKLGNLVAAHRVCNQRKGSSRATGCTFIWLLAVNNRLGVEPMRW